MAEAFTLMRRRLHYRAAMEWVDSVHGASRVTVAPIDAFHDDSVWATLREFSGVPLSYADASLITLARREGIRDIFSFDTDFAACGMRLVPGS